ncbi:hypothetical protein [Micromonospora chokoriensis]|uniref:hypothetical protein n=1 Tax=Micromonospora chokoriensis TaxID=356851 RepID=UPI0004C3D743|nr:hypothetical protein [Micromonospora chokoriensis]
MAEENREATPSDDENRRLIETARWHITRYDGLRSSIANRASFVISANAVLIGGVALLFPSAINQDIYGGQVTVIAMGVAALGVLILAATSIVAATNALLAAKRWRDIYGSDPPPGMFYLHSDTLAVTPTFRDFGAAFAAQTASAERMSATVNLWVVLQTLNYRYRFLRRATRRLQYGFATLACSIAAVIVLSIIGLWRR